ncbi:MAG: flagellin [Hyphomicrobiales bacterium]|nr:flagellin [Hyphomicrobiales bacterium]
MMDSVALSSSMRANLLSLTQTNSLLDSTQLKLSTGRKINSALDGAQSFFASQGLTNRANDLSRLLDSMGQSIQTIKEADKGVSALTSLVEQADSIATSARDAINSATQEAKVTGAVSLSGTTDLTTKAGITATSQLEFSVVKADGTTASLQSSGVVSIAANDSIEQLVTKINDLNQGLTSNVVEAKLDDSGQLQIKALDGASFTLNFVGDSGSPDSAADNLSLAQALGFGNIASQVADGSLTGTNQDYDVQLTAKADSSLTSIALYESTNTIAKASDSLLDLENSAGTSVIGTHDADDTDDALIVGYNGNTTSFALEAVAGNPLTVQGLVDKINNDTTLKGKIEATFDDTTGKLNIRAVDASVESVQFGVHSGFAGGASGSTGLSAGFGFGIQSTVTATALTTGAAEAVETIRLGESAGELAQLEQDYDKLRTQIDELVADASYRGVNLMNGDDLTTYFNEDRTSSLTSTGQIMTSAALGISAANFATATTIDSALTEVRGGLDTVRNFGSSLANDLAVIQTREDFTSETINTLEEGSDKLTLADSNEEGAKMLALQTRLQLGVTSLALASQSAQSVLSLF